MARAKSKCFLVVSENFGIVWAICDVGGVEAILLEFNMGIVDVRNLAWCVHEVCETRHFMEEGSDSTVP